MTHQCPVILKKSGKRCSKPRARDGNGKLLKRCTAHHGKKGLPVVNMDMGGVIKSVLGGPSRTGAYRDIAGMVKEKLGPEGVVRMPKVDTRNVVRGILATQMPNGAATDISELVSAHMSKEHIDRLYLQLAVGQNKMTSVVKYMFHEMLKLKYDLQKPLEIDLEIYLYVFFDIDDDDDSGPKSLYDVYLRLLQSEPDKIKKFFTSEPNLPKIMLESQYVSGSTNVLERHINYVRNFLKTPTVPPRRPRRVWPGVLRGNFPGDSDSSSSDEEGAAVNTLNAQSTATKKRTKKCNF